MMLIISVMICFLFF